MPHGIDKVEYDSALPERSDVVVIGGGIAGVSSALALAEKGVSVTLCEKGSIAAEQSSRNWGWCRVMGRDPAEIPLALESLQMWREMNNRTGGETGFRQAGTMYLCDSRRELDQLAGWLDHARAWQLDTHLLDGNEVAAMLPGMQRRFSGGLHTPSDGRAEPQKAVPAMAMAARRAGVKVLGGCAVRGVETEAGAVSGVVTERGSIRCSSVVLAGGAWSRLFCGNLGLSLPQLKLLGSVMRTEPVEGPPDCAVGASNFAFRKRLDGGFTVARRNASIADIVPESFRLFSDFLPSLRTSWRELRLRTGRRFLEEWQIKRRWSLDEVTPFEHVRVLDPQPSTKLLTEGWAHLCKAVPAFAKARIVEQWGGLIDVTPDAVPVISAAPTVPGFYLATGFSGHGFGIGPAAGRLMADLVVGDQPIVDPTPYAFARFK
jgi:glycine/D-amino acid oxidase-like deaminating enzyme